MSNAFRSQFELHIATIARSIRACFHCIQNSVSFSWQVSAHYIIPIWPKVGISWMLPVGWFLRNALSNNENYPNGLFPFLSFTILAVACITIVGAEGYCWTWSQSMTHAHTYKLGRTPLSEPSASWSFSIWQHKTRETDIHAPRRDLNPQSSRESSGRPTPTRPLIQDFRAWSDLNSVLLLSCRR